MKHQAIRRRIVTAAAVLGLAVTAACGNPDAPVVSPAANPASAAAAGSATAGQLPGPTAVAPSAPSSGTADPAVSAIADVKVPESFNISPDQHRVTSAADPAAAAKLPEAIKKSGVLVIGTGSAGGGTPPLGFTADDDKTKIGVEVDIAALLADKLGLKADIQPTTWENLFIGVDSGKYQVALSNIGVSEERKEKYDFATYRLGLHAFETKKGSGLHISKPADVAGKTVAVGSGTLQEAILVSWDEQNKAAGLPPVNIKYFQNATDYYLALASGRIDIYLGPNPVAVYHVVTAGQTEIVGTVSSSYPLTGKVGVLTKKDNGLVGALAAAIDSAIADGTYAQVLDRWGLGSESVPKSEINPPGLPKPTATG